MWNGKRPPKPWPSVVRLWRYLRHINKARKGEGCWVEDKIYCYLRGENE